MIDWSLPEETGARLVVSEPWELMSTEDIECASENLSESELWHLEAMERRAVVDMYTELEVRLRFIAYMRGRAKRALNGHDVYVLRWPHRTQPRRRRLSWGRGRTQKLVGGWWRATLVEISPWRMDQRYCSGFEDVAVYSGAKVGVWFNPATGRWRVG